MDSYNAVDVFLGRNQDILFKGRKLNSTMLKLAENL